MNIFSFDRRRDKHWVPRQARVHADLALSIVCFQEDVLTVLTARHTAFLCYVLEIVAACFTIPVWNTIWNDLLAKLTVTALREILNVRIGAAQTCCCREHCSITWVKPTVYAVFGMALNGVNVCADLLIAFSPFNRALCKRIVGAFFFKHLIVCAVLIALNRFPIIVLLACLGQIDFAKFNESYADVSRRSNVEFDLLFTFECLDFIQLPSTCRSFVELLLPPFF